ncbi:MAG: FkbM family methyltransferase [Ardenticatenaceae bacterium]|nr:FkbM family methyltransferase [Ardenticatenaceae bacterium]
MNFFPHTKVLLRKGKSFIDRLATIVEVKENRALLHTTNLPYIERKFFQQFRPLMADLGKLVVYDIGAHTGAFSLTMAQVRNVQCVYAFEPLKVNYEQLVINTTKFPQIGCFNVALGRTTQQALFYQSEFRAASSLLPMTELHKAQFPYSANISVTEVQVVSLDEFVKTNDLKVPDLIKIDVQGYEGNVLRGGQETIMNAKYCVIEMNFQQLYEHSALFADVYDLMHEMGFTFVGIIDSLSDQNGCMLQIDGVFRKA